MSSGVSGASAFWGLVPLALCKITGPGGRICGFHPSLRPYLCTSPIVCVADSFTCLMRLLVYKSIGNTWCNAAKLVLMPENMQLSLAPSEHDSSVELNNMQSSVSRISSSMDIESQTQDITEEVSQNEAVRTPLQNEVDHAALQNEAVHTPRDREPQLWDTLNFRVRGFLSVICFILGVLPPLVKITAWKGFNLTVVWAWCYVGSFIFSFVVHVLAYCATGRPKTIDQNDLAEILLGYVEQTWGIMSILLQMLSWAFVDFKRITPDEDLTMRYRFRFLRFLANLPSLLFYFWQISEGRRFFLSTEQMVWAFVLLGSVLFALYYFLGFVYTFIYLWVSFNVSFLFVWPFSFSEFTRRNILFCTSEIKYYWNMAAFEFGIRNLGLAVFWYFCCYDQTNTIGSELDDILG